MTHAEVFEGLTGKRRQAVDLLCLDDIRQAGRSFLVALAERRWGNAASILLDSGGPVMAADMLWEG